MEEPIVFIREMKNTNMYLWMAIGAFLVASLQILGGVYSLLAYNDLFSQTYLAPVWVIIGSSWLYRRKWCKKTPYIIINHREVSVFKDFLRRPVFFNLSSVSTFQNKNKNTYIITLKDSTKIKLHHKILKLEDFIKLHSILLSG
ncbi:MAG: hypothetical protein JEY91_01730 [Spirochaetaceae bacterium]|nr:hypothetical protein [Spirochaetaceae bacterium]